MFKKTSRQIALFNPQTTLSDSARQRLQQTWATRFQAEVLPVLLRLEPRFAPLYCADNGRPNWSIAQRVGLCILKEMLGLTDQAAVDALAFDLRVQVALGLDRDQAYLSRRSLVDFRARLVQFDPQMKLIRAVFEAVGSEAMARLAVSATEQRVDATLVTSNITTHGRADLFGKTLRHFHKWLAENAPELVPQLGSDLQQWLDRDPEGWLGHTSPSAVRTSLQERATWAVEVVTTFAHVEAVAKGEPWQLVERLVKEHVEITKDDSKSEEPGELNVVRPVRVRAKPTGSTLQSPFDPDAGCGHKGPGYHVHITETCRNEGTEIITHFDVVPAQTSDRAELAVVLQGLEASGHKPEKLYADGGYASGVAILQSKQAGVELIAPVNAGPLEEEHVGRDQFTFDEQGHVVQCPKGHAPIRHGLRRSDTTYKPELHAFFDRKLCDQCPLLGKCASRRPNSGKGLYHMEIRDSLLARDRALALQRQKEWWTTYAIRSGVEATMSELKRSHGLGRLRVRRMPRVRLAVGLKVTACNVKRWLRPQREKHVQKLAK